MQQLILSQDMRFLSEALSRRILPFSSALGLHKQWIVVPSLAIKEWLLVQLTQFSPRKGLAGVHICLPEEILQKGGRSRDAMALSIYRLLSDEQEETLQECLASLQRKQDLSWHLADLFSLYQRYGFFPDSSHWQGKLYQHIFSKTSLPEGAIHLFGFCFPPQIPAHFIYLFSPCQEFWEDIVTSKAQHPESEAPSLLTYFGRAGKLALQTLSHISSREEAYRPVEGFSALHVLQKSILGFCKLEKLSPDSSLQIIACGGLRFREVEMVEKEVYYLLKEKQFSPQEIVILAPDISLYAPLIAHRFAEKNIPCKFSFLPTYKKSPFYHAVQTLFDLIQNQWTLENVSALFRSPSFLFPAKEVLDLWIDRILSHPEGWEKGYARLLRDAVSIVPSPKQELFSIGDLSCLEGFVSTLRSLQEDLLPLKEAVFSLQEWRRKWETLSSKYLRFDPALEEDGLAKDAFSSALQRLEGNDFSYPLSVIEKVLLVPSFGSVRSHHLHAISCLSIEEGSTIPARAIFVLGLLEEEFPKIKPSSSLNLLKNTPSEADMGRYLFLQMLLNAEERLYLSYLHISSEDGKEVLPSIVVQDLLREIGPEFCRTLEMRTQKDIKTFLPVHFSYQPKEPFSIQEVSLQDLTLFAKHPWKYYFRKKENISFEEDLEKNAQIERSMLLRKRNWDTSFLLTLRKDLFPSFFEKAFCLGVEKTGKQYQRRIAELEKKTKSLRWMDTASEEGEFLPLEVTLLNGSLLRIYGEVPFALEDGFFHFGENSLPSLLKVWPALLCTLISLDAKKVYFAKTDTVKTLNDPRSALKEFLEYFVRCQDGLSPLIPEWSEFFLRGKNFPEKMTHSDLLRDWMIDRLDPLDPKELFHKWAWMQTHFQELIQLYPVRNATV